MPTSSPSSRLRRAPRPRAKPEAKVQARLEPIPEPSEQPILSILGQQVGLGPLRHDLLPTYRRWISDFAVSRTLAIGLRPFTLEDEQAWYEAATRQPNTVVFLIYERATVRPIGVTELRDVDHQHGTAEFAIMIGERECWGRGYGTEVARLMLDYAFTALGLHNVQLRAYAFNQRGLGAYRRAGFKEFGRRREARRLGSRRYDIVHMDCLASEFESPALREIVDEYPPTKDPSSSSDRLC